MNVVADPGVQSAAVGLLQRQAAFQQAPASDFGSSDRRRPETAELQESPKCWWIVHRARPLPDRHAARSTPSSRLVPHLADRSSHGPPTCTAGETRRGRNASNSGAPRRSRPIRAGESPAAEGPASHGEASLATVPVRTPSKRRQRDGQAATRKGEEIEPRYDIDRGPTGSDSWKATVGARHGESAGDLGGV